MKWIRDQLIAIAVYFLFAIVYLLGNSPIGLWASKKIKDIITGGS